MSKAQHTPGPWTLQRFGVIYGGPFQQYTNGSAQSQIGMATGADFMVEGEREANAKLMAAAPDLLHALSALIRAAIAHGVEETQFGQIALSDAQEALAKATE